MNLEYDLCFVGTAHADRPMIVQDLLKEIGATRKVFTFLYLQIRMYYVCSTGAYYKLLLNNTVRTNQRYYEKR